MTKLFRVWGAFAAMSVLVAAACNSSNDGLGGGNADGGVIDIENAGGGSGAGSGGAGGAGAKNGPSAALCATLSCSGKVADFCCPASCDALSDVDCPGCGNGFIEPGETCDPASTCEQECAPVVCKKRRVKGGGTCSALCVDDGVIASCVDGDGCCPPGCFRSSDNDCPATCEKGAPAGMCDPDQGGRCGDETDGRCPGGCNQALDRDCAPCGNGKLDPGETCDPPGQCETKQAECVAAGGVASGSANTCAISCVACGAADGICPSSACKFPRDPDCAGCGNRKIDANETCDPPASCAEKKTACEAMKGTGKGDPAACTFVCTACSGAACASCGNDKVEGDETCDPPSDCAAKESACVAAGGAARGSSTGCTFSCAECGAADGFCPSASCRFPKDPDCVGCGNTRIESGETCDPPSACTSGEKTCLAAGGAASGSTSQCTFSCITCGARDGVCPSSSCTFAKDPDCPGCGDGKLATGETCDPPSDCEAKMKICVDGGGAATGNTATCTASCLECGPKDGRCPSSACTGAKDPDCITCGNSVRDPGETCEPTSQCDQQSAACVSDGNTIRQRTGDTKACTFVCKETPRICGDNMDGACPTGCVPTRDTDCPGCGNSRIEPNLQESCDPPGMCEEQKKACYDVQGAPMATTGDTATCTFQCLKKKNGDRCNEKVPSECQSGQCVDSHCCGSASCGQCQRCTSGTCQAVAGTTDPDSCTGTCNADAKCTPFIDVAPASTDFSYNFAKEGVTNSYLIRNTSNTLTTGPITIDVAPPFHASAKACDALGPGLFCTVRVTYKPAAGDPDTGTLTVSASPGGKVARTLTTNAVIIVKPPIDVVPLDPVVR